MSAFLLSKFGSYHLAREFVRGFLPVLAAAWLVIPSATTVFAQSRLDRARDYFAVAQDRQKALEAIPVAKRTERDYKELMEAYRRVYFTAPTYGNSTICLMAIGALAEEAAPRFDNPQYFQKAIESYEFLLQQYPHSQFRFEALLSIARIYGQELNQPEKALEQYERYLTLFPGSAQTKAVKEEIATLKSRLAKPAEVAEVLPVPAGPKLHPQAEKDGSENRVTETRLDPPASPIIVGTATVSDIRYWKTLDYTRVVVEMARPVKYEVGRVDNPDRLYLDLFDTRVSPASGKSVPVSDEMLQGIRVAQFNATTSRVVLDLSDKTEFAISELMNPYRLVIDVRGAGARQDVGTDSKVADAGKPLPAANRNGKAPKASPAVERAAVSPAKNQQVPVKEAADRKQLEEKLPEPVEVASASPALPAAPVPDKIKAADPINGGMHSLTRALGLKIGRILIDPGHGGHDTGGIGPSGYTEKELVLDISQRLGKLIESGLGSEVIFTRQADQFVSLEERARLANQQQADLFISIHANSSRSQTAIGIETYYLSLTGDPEALEVAARENAGSQETISELQGLVSKIALNDKVDESKEFAQRIQAALHKNLAGSNGRKFNRGVKKAPFVVLIGADMPAILAEVSFLSNPEEEKRLKTGEYRQQIAEALYEGVASYAESLSGVKPVPVRADKAEPTQTASLD